MMKLRLSQPAKMPGLAQFRIALAGCSTSLGQNRKAADKQQPRATFHSGTLRDRPTALCLVRSVRPANGIAGSQAINSTQVRAFGRAIEVAVSNSARSSATFSTQRKSCFTSAVLPLSGSYVPTACSPRGGQRSWLNGRIALTVLCSLTSNRQRTLWTDLKCQLPVSTE